MEGDGPVSHEQVDELRDDLLGVLVGAVDVVATRDDNGQVERAVVGLRKELGAGLGGSVGVGGLEGRSGGRYRRGGIVSVQFQNQKQRTQSKRSTKKTSHTHPYPTLRSLPSLPPSLPSVPPARCPQTWALGPRYPPHTPHLSSNAQSA